MIRRLFADHLRIEASLGKPTVRGGDEAICAADQSRTGLEAIGQDGIAMAPSDDPDARQLLSVAAAELYRMRRARDHVIPSELVGEPAWDMLLALYSEQPGDICLSSVCHGSGVPQTTALRWISVLEQGGLVKRVAHPRDERIVLLSLTPEGLLTVEDALKAMLNAARD